VGGLVSARCSRNQPVTPLTQAQTTLKAQGAVETAPWAMCAKLFMLREKSAREVMHSTCLGVAFKWTGGSASCTTAPVMLLSQDENLCSLPMYPRFLARPVPEPNQRCLVHQSTWSEIEALSGGGVARSGSGEHS